MKYFQFVLLGSLSLLAATQSIAESNTSNYIANPSIPQSSTIELSTIKNNVYSIINDQFKKGFLTEKADISINIISSELEQKDKNTYVYYIPHFDNHLSRLANGCHIFLDFNKNGLIDITENSRVLSHIHLENDTQIKMFEQFVALHEHYHCEFGHIESPVLLDGKDQNFNQKLNYILKDQFSFSNVSQFSYIDTLNENFADVSAVIALIKEYGENNSDLLSTIYSISLQRHAQYFESPNDSHITHFSLLMLLEHDNIEKILHIKNMNEFQQLALSISNKGVQQFMQYNQAATSNFTFFDSIYDSVLSQAINLIRYESMSEQEKKKSSFSINPWKEQIQRGLSFDMAQNAIVPLMPQIKEKHFYNRKGELTVNYQEVASYTKKLLEHTKIDPALMNAYQNSTAILEEFKHTVLSQQSSQNIEQMHQSIDYISHKLSKEEIKEKIEQLNSQSVKTLDNHVLSSTFISIGKRFN